MKCSQEVIDAIVAHARREEPAECCGAPIGDAAAIIAALPARNLSEHANRFLLDPKGHMDARRRARDLGLEVVGFVPLHSHSPPERRPEIWRRLPYPDLLMMIVSLLSVPADVRVFRVAGDRFEEVPFGTDASQAQGRARALGVAALSALPDYDRRRRGGNFLRAVFHPEEHFEGTGGEFVLHGETPLDLSLSGLVRRAVE